MRAATWNASGALANDARGIAMVEQAWDPRGLRTLARNTDADGEPAKGPEGCATWTATYDDLGHKTAETCDDVARPVGDAG